MEPNLIPANELDHNFGEEDVLVHDWRTEQLHRLGLHRILAEAFADFVDWHVIAKLVERGCPPQLALDIVR
jgi:hypothetical protein